MISHPLNVATSNWQRATTPERAEPPLVADLLGIYRQPPELEIDDILPDPQQLSGRVRGAVDMLVAVEPLLKLARARFRAGLRALVDQAAVVPFDPELAEPLWLRGLPVELLALLDRTLVLEMHVARMQDQLIGDTPEQRFASWIERLSDPAVVLAIFAEYPVLARSLVVCVDQWVAYGLEFFRHLIADWHAIQAAYGLGRDLGELAQIETGAGDPHRQGRSVLLLRFSSGFRLVYKPKALAVDVHFQELIAWLGERGLEPALRTLIVLDRGDYGWIEHVAPATCTGVDQVQRFYRRQGALVLLAYMLGATDFHFENVLAVGEHPVLIDLETLFHPYPNSTNTAELPTDASSHRSVLRAGLLPHPGGGGPGIADLDISGLGATLGQTTEMPTWEGAGTDGLRMSRGLTTLDPSHNRPTLDGAEVDVADHVDDIVVGFTAAYWRVVELREQLLAPDGPIAAFADDPIRVIVRSTQRYAILRYEARHPNVLRDSEAGERLLDQLWREVVHTPYLAHVIPAEREDLGRGDVPTFFTTPAETTLRDSMGRSIEGVIDEPSLAQVVREIRGFGERDLARQLWFLRLSLATLAVRSRGAHERVRPVPPETAAPLERARLLAAAVELGRRLGDVALADNELIYLSASPRNGRWTLGPVDSYLYQGNSGIALFLGYLGTIADDPRATRLARATLQQAAQRMKLDAADIRTIGAFEGWGSLLYATTHLGVLWHDPALIDDAIAIATRIEALIVDDDRLDLIGGAAGAIMVLLGLHQVAPVESVLRTAIACGDHLIRRAQPVGPGLAWPCSEDVLAPLTGFAHGVAGIAWALLALAQATGHRRFEVTAEQAIAYERAAFVPGHGWPDWRKLDGASLAQPTFETAWCHGGPGIGFARLSLVAAGDPLARAELQVAVEMTLRRAHAPDHSLCHGDLGNIELLLAAARLLDDPPLRAEAERRAAILLASIERDGPICGVPLDAEIPGLMIGIAGIGHGLLRLAEPGRVPSVLLLEPPPARS